MAAKAPRMLGGVVGDVSSLDAREDAGVVSGLGESMMSLPDDDYDRFLEMLERSDPQAFRELIERDWGWLRLQ